MEAAVWRQKFLYWLVLTLVNLAVVLLALGIGHGQEQFWTPQTIVTASALTAATGADAWATDRGFESGHWDEHNPLVPHARAGRLAYFSGTLAAGVAGAWLLHRYHHERLAQWAMRIQLGVEVQAAAWSGSHP
jgi:hypothetical protein